MEIKFDTEAFTKFLADGSSKAGLETLKAVLTEAGNSESKFLVEQATLVAKYLNMKKEGKLTPNQTKSLLTDLDATIKIEMLKMNMTTRVAAQKLLDILIEVLKGSLSTLITII